MSQPTYQSAVGYIGEAFFTISFDVALDDTNPPSLSAFDVQVNGTGVTVTGVTINGTAKTATLAINATLLPGDIIDFVYTDPTVGNDVSALQGTDGADGASFSHSIVIAITRPGPSAPSTPTLDSGSDTGTIGDNITADNTPSVSGTADPNAVVKLYDTDGTTLLGTTTADGKGSWGITSSQLGDGSHTLKVTQTDGSSNTSPLSTGLTVNIDTTVNAPATLAVASGSDSGTKGDGISNSGTPIITGTSEANASVTLYDTDGTTSLGTAKADVSGKWSITSSTLVEGSHTLTAKQTDRAGNVSAASSGFTYIMDTVGPVGMALSTNSVTQTSATNGSTIATLSSTDLTSVVYGFAVGNGVIDADNGKFTISGNSLVAAQSLSAGSYHIYLSGTDAAGNAAYNIFTITVTSGPSVSSIVRANSASATVQGSAASIEYTVTFSESVTGVDTSDFTITSTGTASGTVSSVTGSGSTYTVTVNTLGGDGTLRLDLNSSGTGIQNGSSQAITAGYTSGQTYTLDHTAPSTPSTPAMTAGTDTGSSSSDAITSNTTPVFTGTGEANATITLYDTDGVTTVGTATADGSGKWSITSGKLGEGAHTLTVKQSDAAGNVSSASSGLAVVIDTIAPSAPGTPVLSAASDSGTLGDNLTNVATAVITGTGEANAKIKLYDTDGTTLLGTTTADGSGNWSITSSKLSDGTHTLTTKQTDAAGNVSSASNSLSLDIDTSTPVVPGTPTLATASDGGTLGDGLTNVTTPVITGTGTAGNTVKLYDTDGTTLLGSAVVDGSGNWSITSSTLADGGHTLTAKQQNPAGTVSSASASLSLTIDGTVPTAPSTPAMTSGTDTGSSTSDAITSNTTPIFTGTGEANATVTLYDTDGVTSLGSTTADGSGNWSITSGKLATGAHTLTVKQSDEAGNVSAASASLAVVIDTTAPSAPGTPVLSTASDSGTLGDNLTSTVTPTLTGTGEANATVKLYDTDGVTLLGTATADGSGNWSITSSKLGDGAHTLTAKQTDAAGNVSSASSSLSLSIDTSIPTAPGTPVLATASDGGTLGDGLTNVTTPVITGTGTAGNTIKLYDTNGTTLLGSAVVDGGGNWSITSSSLGDGAHSLTVKQQNPAGTLSSASSALSLVIDSSAPSAPSAPSMTAASDSGSADNDANTNVTTPVFTGTGEANAIVKLYDTGGTTLLGSATADGAGKWSITSSKLGDGAHALTVKQTDAAGNVSAASGSLLVHIDSSAPAMPGALALSVASDSGVKNDNRTNVAAPIITGTGEAQATVKLYDTDGVTVLGTTTADSSGNWSVTASALGDGPHTLTAKQTDAAGNVSSASSTLVLTIDTAAPGAPGALAIASASDSGAKGDGLTNVATPVITGTGAVGNTVTLYDTNGVTVLGTGLVDDSGHWSITSSTLGSGAHSLTTRQVNPAGTSSATSAALNVKVDTAAPTVAIALAKEELASGASTNVTFTFSEAVTGFGLDDLTIGSGQVTGLASSDGGITWNATYTPAAGVETQGSVLSLNMAGVADAAGNAGAGKSDAPPVKIDTKGPSATISVSDTQLSAGENAVVTIQFSEAVTGVGGVQAAHGALSSFASADGGVTWTATFTPEAGQPATSTAITLDASSITDKAGNRGVGTVSSPAIAIDNARPTATLSLSDTALKAGETATLTVAFNMAVQDFSAASLTLGNASLSGLASSDGGKTWTGTLTPAAGVEQANNTVSLALGNIHGANGSAGSGTATVGYSIDTLAPGASIAISDTLLAAGEAATVTVTFTEAVNGFTSGALSAPNATLSAMASSDGGKTWVGQLTPSNAAQSVNALTLNLSQVTDKAGNAGTGTATSATYTIDTVAPTASVAVGASTLVSGESAAITITFSEKVPGLTASAITAGNATVSNLASSDGGLTWTATLTPLANTSAAANFVTVSGFRDAAGNTGSAATSGGYAVSTVPTVRGTVDGVATLTQTSTDSSGKTSQVVIVPITTPTRSDDPNSAHNTLADIPLVASGNGLQSTLTVSLPVGTGLQAEGGTSLLSNSNALLDLIRRIENKTDSGSSVQQLMTGQGTDFLSSLPNSTVLQTQTITPVVSNNAAPGNILISDNAPSQAGGQAVATGLVIDTRNVPTGTTLQLDNVEFAAVVGQATLRGGNGANYVVGDSASQNIFLGADDDKLFGGAGDDIVGSAGGDDYLDGGTGADIVVGGIGNDTLVGGEGNDSLQGGRSDVGQWQFMLAADGAISARHGLATFAPGTTETLARTELDATNAALAFIKAGAARLADIALLYHTAFGRAADIGGMNFWAGTSMSLEQMANAFLQSSEWKNANGTALSDEAFVTRIYNQALGRQPEPAGLAFWLGILQQGKDDGMTRARVLAAISDSAEHETSQTQSGSLVIGSGLVSAEQGWISGSGADWLIADAGSDRIVGGDGNDTVQYANAMASYRFLVSRTGDIQVLDTANGDLDTLVGVETVKFANSQMAVPFTTMAGQKLADVALLYHAALGRAGESGGMAYWLAQSLDRATMAALFTQSSEFAQRSGSLSNAQLVHQVYQNLALQSGTAGGEQVWVDYLNTHTRAELIGAITSNADVLQSAFGAGITLG